MGWWSRRSADRGTRAVSVDVSYIPYPPPKQISAQSHLIRLLLGVPIGGYLISVGIEKMTPEGFWPGLAFCSAGAIWFLVFYLDWLKTRYANWAVVAGLLLVSVVVPSGIVYFVANRAKVSGVVTECIRCPNPENRRLIVEGLKKVRPTGLVEIRYAPAKESGLFAEDIAGMFFEAGRKRPRRFPALGKNLRPGLVIEATDDETLVAAQTIESSLADGNVEVEPPFVTGNYPGIQIWVGPLPYEASRVVESRDLETKLSELQARGAWRDLTPAQKQDIANAIGRPTDLECHIDMIKCDSRSEDEPCDFAQKLYDALIMSDWRTPAIARSSAPPIPAGVTITFSPRSKAPALRLQAALDRLQLKPKVEELSTQACFVTVAIGTRFTR